MCGIIGMAAVRPLHELEAPPAFERALSVLRHRGPDAEGQFRDGAVWLGHARLSIIDLSAAGAQPMQTDSGRFVISYNGEVYNFRELAAEYGLSGLRSSSDTEVVLRLFEKLGTDSLIRLNGMFAFCVYDRQERKIWLPRDRLGIKPLYYRLTAGALVFASEIKSILALDAAAPQCDVATLHEWLLYGNPLGGRTLYRGIRQLLPGHCMELDLGSFACVTHEYWSVARQAAAAAASTDQGAMIASVRRLLEEAVRRQLVSDVPVGVFLSGGIDSSAIAAFASRHYAGKLATYSVGFDFAPDGGELPAARRTAARYGTDHHEIRITGEDVPELVERMVVHHDMPFGDAANIPLYLMAHAIRDHTKVVLQGDGGDELFGGYRRYATLKHHASLHFMAAILQYARFALPRSPLGCRVERYLDAYAARDLTTTIALLLTSEDMRWSPADIFASALRVEVLKSDPFARYRELAARFDGQDIGNRMSFTDMSVVLPDTYLEKVDRSTMAASVEVRVPFLDHDLVDHVLRLPGGAKMPFGRKKWLLKCALRGVVPDEILDGRKIGFNVPFGRWLQTSLRPLFFDHLTRFGRTRPDVLNVPHITQLFERTRSGLQDHSPLLWRVLNFLVWANGSDVEIRTPV